MAIVTFHPVFSMQNDFMIFFQIRLQLIFSSQNTFFVSVEISSSLEQSPSIIRIVKCRLVTLLPRASNSVVQGAPLDFTPNLKLTQQLRVHPQTPHLTPSSLHSSGFLKAYKECYTLLKWLSWYIILTTQYRCMGLFPLKSSPHLFSHVIFTEILRKKSVTKAVIVNPTFQNKNQGISSYKRLEESKQKSVLTF